MFGVSDVSIKAVTSGGHGLLGVLALLTLMAVLTGIGGFYASARSFQIGDGVAVIAAAASAANVLGILGGIVVFGDPIGRDLPTVAGRLLAFILVVVAVGLIPAPVRAHRAASEESSGDTAGPDGELPSDRRTQRVPALGGGDRVVASGAPEAV
jgi:hypothetical protein